MKKFKRIYLLIGMTMLLMCFLPAYSFAADFTPNPQTAYAKSFIDSCDGQTWFINEVERLLNSEQKTLNTINSISDLDGIKSLGLKDAGIDGAIPDAIGELKELEYLFLSGNHMKGTLPKSLFTLPKLKNIDLGGSDYAGDIPAEFGNMPALTVLNLSGNKYTGNVPASILANTRIEFLNLMENDLSGGVPAGIAGMTGLKYLNLSKNDLKGEIPDLSQMTNLIALSMWGCGLTGEIPDSVFSLTKLQIIDLSDNKLEGEVSDSFSELKEIQYLALDNNQLRGVLKDDIWSSTLSEIHLENNYFRGTAPSSLKRLSDEGKKVFLNDNYMTGNTLKEMVNNSGNFTDGASTGQYQLSSNREKLQVSKDAKVNLFGVLYNKPLSSGSTDKIMLDPDEYTVSCDNTKVEISYDENGFYAKALTDIPEAEAVTATIRIKDNNDSAYSTVNIILTTSPVSGGTSGGGGGGGGGGGSTGNGGLPTTSGGGIDTGDDPLPPENTGIVHEPYINGFTDGNFHAAENITREQTAKMLTDAMGKDISTAGSVAYPDVDKDGWSYPWICTASREGYMQGYVDGNFEPVNPITRAEMATVLTRIAAKEGLLMTGTDRTFSDVKEGEWYTGYVKQAVQYGLINGYEDGTFQPDKYITRAETVVMINRMLSRKYETAVELHTVSCPFPDVKSDYWAYGDIMEASVKHNH